MGSVRIAMAPAALEDLQAIQEDNRRISHRLTATEVHPGIFQELEEQGCLYTEADGKTYFYYPYSGRGAEKREDGLMLGGADDVGHFSHSMQGVMLVHDATPELGADDDFMTAIANAVHHNSIPRMDPFNAPLPTRLSPSVAKSGQP
jgi:hypothetical protein